MKEGFSRRGFFKELFPSKKESVPVPEGTQEEIKRFAESHEDVSRRDFLKFLIGLGSALALSHVGIRHAESGKPEEGDPESQEKKQQQPEESQSSASLDKTVQASGEKNKIEGKVPHGYLETMIETSLLYIGELIMNTILAKLKIEQPSKVMQDPDRIKSLIEKPFEDFILHAIAAPAIEETLFRLVPSAFIGKKGGIRWDAGIPVSVIFALMHNLEVNEFKEFKFRKVVPLSQFIQGVFYWYLMREKGVTHAMFAHSMHNSLNFIIATVFLRAFPGKTAKSEAMSQPEAPKPDSSEKT